jgi:hypothetical protein
MSEGVKSTVFVSAPTTSDPTRLADKSCGGWHVSKVPRAEVKGLAGPVHFNTKKRKAPKTKAKVRADEGCPCSPVKSPHLVKKPRTMPGLSR